MNRKIRWITEHIAPRLNLIVFACLVITAAASLAGITLPSHTLLLHVLLGGFIGGTTNKIAITMLFEKKWFLPGSGVLLQKHKDIIRSLAKTVEKHLVNSEMLQSEVKKLLKPVNAGKAEEIINKVIDEFRGDLCQFLLSPKVHDEIRYTLRTRLGFLGKFLNATGIKQYDQMADTIIGELLDRIQRLRVTKRMVLRTIQKVGTLEDFLFMPNNELVVRHYHTDRSIAQLFFDNLDIQSMVADKLGTYEPSKVRDILEENIRSHLIWLEVFGVLLGMLFSGLVFLFIQVLSLPL